MDRKDLKIEAYRQRVAQIVTEYEDKCVDYRVEITELDERARQLQGQLDTVVQELEVLRNVEASQQSTGEADESDEVPE